VSRAFASYKSLMARAVLMVSNAWMSAFTPVSMVDNGLNFRRLGKDSAVRMGYLRHYAFQFLEMGRHRQ